MCYGEDRTVCVLWRGLNSVCVIMRAEQCVCGLKSVDRVCLCGLKYNCVVYCVYVCVCVCCVCGKIQRQVGILISSNICCSSKELSMLSRKGRHRTESFKNLLRGLVQTVLGKISVIETLTY